MNYEPKITQTIPDNQWPFQLTAHFVPSTGRLDARQTLITSYSYFRMLNMLTPEQRNELFADELFHAISVRVSTPDDAPLA